jgi:hypothetical protein
MPTASLRPTTLITPTWRSLTLTWRGILTISVAYLLFNRSTKERYIKLKYIARAFVPRTQMLPDQLNLVTIRSFDLSSIRHSILPAKTINQWKLYYTLHRAPTPTGSTKRRARRLLFMLRWKLAIPHAWWSWHKIG